jgi:hypothetical protein
MVQPFYNPEPHVLGWLRAFTLPSDVVLDVGSGDGRHRDIGAGRYCSLDSWPAAEPDFLLDLEKENLPEGKFSLILLIDLLEHLSKERGRDILNQAQAISTRAVVVLTPLKWNDNRDTYEDKSGFYYKNEAVLHRSLWNLSDFNEQWVRVWLPSTQHCFFGYWVKQ